MRWINNELINEGEETIMKSNEGLVQLTNMRYRTNDGLMLVHRRGRCPKIKPSAPPAASWLTGRLCAWISLLVLLLLGLFHALHIDHQRVWIQLLIITWLGAISFRAAICIARQHTATGSYRCCRFGDRGIFDERSRLREISSDLYDVSIGGSTVTWWEALQI